MDRRPLLLVAGLAALAAPAAAPHTADAATVLLGASEARTSESSGSVPVTIVSSGENDVAVTYETASGTAESGVDFTPKAGTITLPQNLVDGVAVPTTATILVPIARDLLDEQEEDFSFRLTGVDSGNTLASPSVETVSVTDSTSVQALQFGLPTVFATEGSGAAVIPVVRSSGAGGEVTMQYETRPGTAVPGVDYTPVSGTLTFAPNVTFKTLRVPIVQNQLHQPGDRTFAVAITGVGGTAKAGKVDAVAVGIVDDDQAPALRFASSELQFGERTGGTVVTVLRVGASGSAASATWTASGAASAKGAVTFAPGQVAANFYLKVKPDPKVTGDRTVKLTLSAPQGATVVEPVSAGVVVHDADAPPPGPPTAKVSLARRQRAQGHPGVLLRIRPNSKQELDARGTVRLGGTALKLGRVRRTLAPNASAKVVVPFTPGSWARIALAQRARRAVRATVTLRLKDPLGRRLTVRRSVTIVR